MDKHLTVSAEQVDAAQTRIVADAAVGRITDPRIVAIAKVSAGHPVNYQSVSISLGYE